MSLFEYSSESAFGYGAIMTCHNGHSAVGMFEDTVTTGSASVDKP